MLKKLRASYPHYDKAITFVLIDWDAFGSHDVTTSRAVSRRSTLLLIKDGMEIDRLVAQINEHKIKALLDSGLK